MTMQNDDVVVEDSSPSPAGTGIDILSGTDIVDITMPQIDVDEPEAISPPPTPAIPVTPEPPAPSMPDPQLAQLAQQNQALQQQVEQWTQWQNQQAQERDILAAMNARRLELENAGWSEDQITSAVTREEEFQRRETELQANLQRTQLHEQGRYRAAMFYGKQHGVDADQLLSYNSPQEMETRAREISRISQLEAKLAKYEKAQVPPQNFDSGTSQVSAASNEEQWMDRYNAGDRSPEALAAARRAAGLG